MGSILQRYRRAEWIRKQNPSTALKKHILVLMIGIALEWKNKQNT